MHVRVRAASGEEHVVPIVSRLSGIEELRRAVKDKFSIPPDRQRLFYGGKLLENGYNLHDYSIKLNDVIQLMVRAEPQEQQQVNGKVEKKEEKGAYEDAKSTLYAVGDLIDMRDREQGAWFEGTIIRIVRDPDYVAPSKPKPNGTSPNDEPSTPKSSKMTNPKSSKMTNGEDPKSPKKTNSENSKSSKMTNGENSKSSKMSNGETSKPSSPKTAKKDIKKVPNGEANSSPKASESKSPLENGQSPKEGQSPKTPNRKKGITDYFSKTPKSSKKAEEEKAITENGVNGEQNAHVNGEQNGQMNGEETNSHAEDGVLYKILLVYDDLKEELCHYCKAQEIRPRARREIPIEKLNIGETVMINYNTEDNYEKGYCHFVRPTARYTPLSFIWEDIGHTHRYDFIVQDVIKQRKSYELVGTLFLGREAVPQNDTKIRLLDKIYAIEEVVPISKRSKEYSELMTTPTEQRALPLNCTRCRDNEKRPCRDCGCNICSGKEDPEKIVLCDECNTGFHMKCLDPPMSELPEEDWYCVSCKRDPNDVVAPGAARQTKKASRAKGKRDWGRGMACVGKTQNCAMPANHFGPIPGIEVGMAWRFRIQLSESGVHRPPVSGIHGRDTHGAYSLVLSGGYEDDVDNGTEFTYTGSGGRDLSGNKRTADQSSDQMLTRENKALARNCAVPHVSEEGQDAGDRWRDGRPVRVVRSYKMQKHFPEYAPEQGIRYDGIYKVVKYYPETGKSGFRVWKYLLRRDDPNPAPWEPGAKKYPIIFPEGYLEAEEEKKKIKQSKSKKRVLRESNHSDDDSKTEQDSGSESPPSKKRRTLRKGSEDTPPSRGRGRPRKSQPETPKNESPFTKAKQKTPKKEKSPSKSPKSKLESLLSTEELDSIKADELNSKLWEECLEVCRDKGKQHLISHVRQLFLCIICQEVAANPVTTRCQHNFCMSCLKLAFRSTEANNCPYCRQDLSKDQLEQNEHLKTALRTLMPGYDMGKK